MLSSTLFLYIIFTSIYNIFSSYRDLALLLIKQRLKGKTPRQIDSDLSKVMTRFEGAQTDMEKSALAESFAQQETYQRSLQEKRLSLMKKFRESQTRNTQTYMK